MSLPARHTGRRVDVLAAGARCGLLCEDAAAGTFVLVDEHGDEHGDEVWRVHPAQFHPAG